MHYEASLFCLEESGDTGMKLERRNKNLYNYHSMA
jgi:hypothetical protein